MAYVITDNCQACGECVEVCPIGSVLVGDPIYVIDDTCCDFAECVIVCPHDAIIEFDKLESATTEKAA